MYIKKDILEKYKSLEDKFEKNKEKKLLYSAFLFAYKKHKDQKNIDWKEVIVHLINTALIAFSIIKEVKISIFSLLHHSFELEEEEEKILEKNFWKEILKFLKWLKALKQEKYNKWDIEKNPNLFAHFLKLAENDIRVFLIKICSRLEYIESIRKLSMKPKKQVAIETLEIYIPLIRLFGLNRYIRDIEDICYKNIKPKEYKQVEQIIKEKKEFLEDKIENLKEIINDIAFENNLNIKLEARIKSIYSIAKKMENKKVPISGIYDLIALRIITKTKKEAYIFLWLVHSVFKVKENRIKDYISAPKANGYQSIHTTVIDKDWYIFEIQIQTQQMYEFNIFGMASHNLYKWTIKNPKSFPEWMKKIHFNKKKYFLSENITDLFNNTFASNKIICFTPKFDKIELPKNSTIIDFAFKVHTRFWQKLKWAWINWEYIKNLVYILKDKDRVQLDLQEKDTNFKIEYLSKVKTKIAKKNIILSFKNKKEEKVEELWKYLLDQRTNLLEFKTFDKMPKVLQNQILEKNNFENKKQLYFAIWIGISSVDKVIKQINNLEWNNLKYKTIVKLIIKFKINNYKNINSIFNVFHNHNVNIINIDYKWIIAETEINVKNLETLNDVIIEISRLPNIYSVVRVFSSKMKKFILIFWLFTLWTIFHPLVIIWLNHFFDISKYIYNWFFYFNIIFFILMIYFLKHIAKISLPGILSENFFWKAMFLLNTFTLITVWFESIYLIKNQNIILLFSFIILLYWLTIFEYIDFKNKNNS